MPSPRLTWFNETTGNSDFRPSKCRDSFRCEYAAIVYTLGHCKDIKVGDEVEIWMDNEVVAQQLNHDSAINDDYIRTEAFRIWGWGRKKNNRITFVRISRRENKAGKILGS